MMGELCYNDGALQRCVYNGWEFLGASGTLTMPPSAPRSRTHAPTTPIFTTTSEAGAGAGAGEARPVAGTSNGAGFPLEPSVSAFLILPDNRCGQRECSLAGQSSFCRRRSIAVERERGGWRTQPSQAPAISPRKLLARVLVSAAGPTRASRRVCPGPGDSAPHQLFFPGVAPPTNRKRAQAGGHFWGAGPQCTRPDDVAAAASAAAALATTTTSSSPTTLSPQPPPSSDSSHSLTNWPFLHLSSLEVSPLQCTILPACAGFRRTTAVPPGFFWSCVLS